MTTTHRRNSNTTYPNSHVRNNGGIHARSIGSRITSVPLMKNAVPHAGFGEDDGGLSVAVASLRLSPGSNHPRALSGGSSSRLTASTSNSRFERTNNVPPRHRGGGEKEYTQIGLQSPREKQRGAYFEQQPPRRQNQQYATSYHNSSNHQLQSDVSRIQSIPPSPSRPYAQIQPQKPANSRTSTTQASSLHQSTELLPLSWCLVYNGNGRYPATSVHHVQLQLQEWYQQQQQLGPLPHARPFMSAQAPQQFAAHFTPQQTRSDTSSPSKSPGGHSRSPGDNVKTRASPSQAHHQQASPQPPTQVLSHPPLSAHSLVSHLPPLIQTTVSAVQATQTLQAGDQALPITQSRSLQARLSELPPLASLWSDTAASQTLAYLHQTLLNEYDLPARDLTVVHYQRLYDGYFEELERDVQRGEARMWVMGMALEEDERTAARERAERSAARDAEEMVHGAQNLEGRFRGTEVPMECTYNPVSPAVMCTSGAME